MSRRVRQKKIFVYGRATTIDARRTPIKTSERSEYMRNVACIREAARRVR